MSPRFKPITKDDSVAADELPVGARPVPGYPSLFVSPRGSVYNYVPTEGYYLLPPHVDLKTGFLCVETQFGFASIVNLVLAGFGVKAPEGYWMLPNDGEPWNADLDNWMPVKMDSPYFDRLMKTVPPKLRDIKETYAA